ncbi:sulfur relay protein DsrC [Marimonas lutisalis]|uniref:sulfur relay protein DsrC n=1 Tax=Marimonas lutisalis TaxID=2545756 RepID=UPI0010F7A6F5|nr:sulfur relay protein DsrC [Marimonas lutisalis]
MARLSDLIIGHPEVTSFKELEELVKHLGQSGEVFMEFDLKPDYRDTPRKWEWILETAFTKGLEYD